MTAAQPGSRTARQARIVDLLAQHHVSGQVQLVKLLADEGIEIAQATLSRDLDELSVRKICDGANGSRYSVIEDTLAASSGVVARMRRVLGELLVSVDHSGTIAIMRTSSRIAQYLASVTDRAGLKEIVGTIAGGGAVIYLAREPLSGADLAQRPAAGANQ